MGMYQPIIAAVVGGDLLTLAVFCGWLCGRSYGVFAVTKSATCASPAGNDGDPVRLLVGIAGDLVALAVARQRNDGSSR